MLIRDVMTKNPICCAKSDKVETVARLMAECDCGEIPVCEGTKLVGVITDRDITCRVVAAGVDPAVVPVAEVMTKNVITIAADAKFETALDLMEARLVRRLPVIDADDSLVGIVSQTDLMAKVPTPTLKVARTMQNVAEKTRRQEMVRP